MASVTRGMVILQAISGAMNMLCGLKVGGLTYMNADQFMPPRRVTFLMFCSLMGFGCMTLLGLL